MSAGALAFMLGSWSCVLGLMGWAFWRILKPRPVPLTDTERNGTAGSAVR